MLRFLTQKLRAQSLNEVLPYEPKIVAELDSDYNTDSEEENQEVEQLLEDKRMCSGSSNLISGPVIRIPHPVRLRPLEDIVNSSENILSAERDRHSSEEELAKLDKQSTSEKRKWSHISRGGIGDVSGSSDEEVKDLCAKPTPLKFSASPPRHLQKLSRKHSKGKATFIAANVGTAGDFVSPRKRHRQAYYLDDQHLQNGRCLDFEKMQQKQHFKKFPSHGHCHNHNHAHSMRAGRLVRIKGINLNNNRIPPRLLCDPAVFSFRSLSTVNPLTPVEDPSSMAAY